MFGESSRRTFVNKSQWPEMVGVRSATPGRGGMCFRQNFADYLSWHPPYLCFAPCDERRSTRGHCGTAWTRGYSDGRKALWTSRTELCGRYGARRVRYYRSEERRVGKECRSRWAP